MIAYLQTLLIVMIDLPSSYLRISRRERLDGLSASTSEGHSQTTAQLELENI